MKNRKTGKAIAAAAMLTIAAMTMPMQTVSAEDIVDAPYNVVVLGDSISTGYGLEDSSKSYVSVLEHHMNQKVTNLAKDGTTSSELLQSLQGVQDAGYQTVFWSGAYVDWKTDDQPNPDTAYETLLSTAHGGEILLLHSVSSTNAAILGDVIDGFRAAGYTV